MYNNSHLKFYLSKDPTGNNHGVVCDIFSEFMFVTLSGHETNFRQSKCKMQFLNYDKPYWLLVVIVWQICKKANHEEGK